MDEEQTVDPRVREVAEGSWLVLSYPGSQTVRIDVTAVDRLLVDDGDLVFSLDSTSMTLTIAGGAAEARNLLLQLGPYTRLHPITSAAQYAEAQRILAEATGDRRQRPVVTVDDVPIIARDGLVIVGAVAFSASEVEEYALRGAALPLPNGTVRAAMAMIAVAAQRRTVDVAAMMKRISQYEAAQDRL